MQVNIFGQKIRRNATVFAKDCQSKMNLATDETQIEHR